MKKLVLAGLIAAVTAVPVIASISPATSANGYWGCAGSGAVEVGVCVRNPLPQHLPNVPHVDVPDAEAPATPEIEVEVDVPRVDEPVVVVEGPSADLPTV
ncbi:MAG TPA: hypothetical protein VF230_04180 [Acidimicrobiales bacterium]